MIDLIIYNTVQMASTGNGVSDLVTTGQNILKAMQALGLISAALAFCVGAYYLMLGGERGRPRAIGWFVGAGVGLVIVMGAYGIAQSINGSISF